MISDDFPRILRKSGVYLIRPHKICAGLAREGFAAKMKVHGPLRMLLVITAFPAFLQVRLHFEAL